jgi:hypothetical protein
VFQYLQLGRVQKKPNIRPSERAVPAIPDSAAKTKYNVPISLWFVEKKNLTTKLLIRLIKLIEFILTKRIF